MVRAGFGSIVSESQGVQTKDEFKIMSEMLTASTYMLFFILGFAVIGALACAASTMHERKLNKIKSENNPGPQPAYDTEGFKIMSRFSSMREDEHGNLCDPFIMKRGGPRKERIEEWKEQAKPGDCIKFGTGMGTQFVYCHNKIEDLFGDSK